jgi:hypothetical protein
MRVRRVQEIVMRNWSFSASAEWVVAACLFAVIVAVMLV